MIEKLLNQARADEPIFITEVDEFLKQLPETIDLHFDLEQIDGSWRTFSLVLPAERELNEATRGLLSDYIFARIYNILSSLGGRSLHVRFDPSYTWLAQICNDLDRQFGIGQSRKDRRGYGRCVNVIDRMLEHIDSGSSKGNGFKFVINTHSSVAVEAAAPRTPTGSAALAKFRAAAQDMAGKQLCGIDVGGTDIKVAAAVNGQIACFKEFDWFPAEYTVSHQLIDPIILLVRLVRAQLSLQALPAGQATAGLTAWLTEALDKHCELARMNELVAQAEQALSGKLVEFDGIGLCFPDVVVKNKVVGGEVYKTRGIRNNPAVDYEVEFAKLSDLDLHLEKFIKSGGQVRMTNDGPMASFTAAVEQAFSDHPERVVDGVYAHTLGTELGTGWIDEQGSIPDIPLEVYNFIIDLGSYGARQYPCDDLRSINNFNTGLAGTLQKYASQSGAFRLALKYFSTARPDLYADLEARGFVVKVTSPQGQIELIVPTEPVDLRKPFLQHLMDLASKAEDQSCAQIFIDIGKFLAVTWAESELIMNPKVKSRVLFGRLVKNQRCFDLMKQGANELYPDLVFEVADGSIANTPLMRQLEADPEYTVAQFAQAIGAIYFGNLQD
jgi:hypothetical protein